jgi:hypothetical protein
VELIECRRPRRHVPEAEGDRGRIEGLIAKWKPECVSLDEVRHTLLFRLGEHGEAKIRSNNAGIRALCPDGEREVATPGGEVEDGAGVDGCDEAGNRFSPEEVKAAAQKVIRKIVASRNRTKRSAYELGILLR